MSHDLADDIPRGVLYLAHPVGGDPKGNLQRAKRWLYWARVHVFRDYEVIAPWFEAIEQGDNDADPVLREYNIRRCERVAAVCDAVLLVGGRVSEGMRREARACATGRSVPLSARRFGLVVDLSVLGAEPPDEIWLRMRARRIFAEAKPEPVANFYVYIDRGEIGRNPGEVRT